MESEEAIVKNKSIGTDSIYGDIEYLKGTVQK
jgi:hypothetical protein